MTQSEIYDRILSGIINDWYYSEHSNMDKLVAKIRELSTLKSVPYRTQ